MEILNWFKKKQTITPRRDDGIKVLKVNPEYKVIEEYYVQKPHSKIIILSSPELREGYHYYLQETELNEVQYYTYDQIVRVLNKEFDSPTDSMTDPNEYIFRQAEQIAERYHKSLGQFTPKEWDEILYHVVRDLSGYGTIQGIMKDPQIEDISCNGVGTPLFVWHRRYESIPTNITFTSHQTLDNFIVKMAHKSSEHISSAHPLLEGMLPEKHRLTATFMNEVSLKGSTFCIRTGTPNPFSIGDLIRLGTLDERIAAYFWLILENKKNFLIFGGTGSGKTSLLSALLNLLSQNDKIVTVEEVPELNPPVSNWTQLSTRESFQFGEGPSGDITLFDLIKVSLRYRPDYVIVGEIRGEEAYVLFQAVATGHGGLCTIHADSVDGVIKRLTSPPMNVSEIYISMMNVVVSIQRVELPYEKNGLSFGRRIRSVHEISKYNEYIEVSNWDTNRDQFNTMFNDSIILKRISLALGVTFDDMLKELNDREKYLKEITKSGIRDQQEITEKILIYKKTKRTKSPTQVQVEA